MVEVTGQQPSHVRLGQVSITFVSTEKSNQTFTKTQTHRFPLTDSSVKTNYLSEHLVGSPLRLRCPAYVKLVYDTSSSFRNKFFLLDRNPENLSSDP